jgi:hypothetical protein
MDASCASDGLLAQRVHRSSIQQYASLPSPPLPPPRLIANHSTPELQGKGLFCPHRAVSLPSPHGQWPATASLPLNPTHRPSAPSRSRSSCRPARPS